MSIYCSQKCQALRESIIDQKRWAYSCDYLTYSDMCFVTILQFLNMMVTNIQVMYRLVSVQSRAGLRGTTSRSKSTCTHVQGFHVNDGLHTCQWWGTSLRTKIIGAFDFSISQRHPTGNRRTSSHGASCYPVPFPSHKHRQPRARNYYHTADCWANCQTTASIIF
jgi:hypothetical protein